MKCDPKYRNVIGYKNVIATSTQEDQTLNCKKC